jgi:transcriptional regulator with XRE-family HTH domain
MINDFALELKVARRKAGLSQADCAHLLGVHPSKVSLLESGKVLPSIRHICRLSEMYGRSFESLFSDIFNDARRDLRRQLHTMPEAPRRWLGEFNRENTLRALEHRLNSNPDESHGS